MTDLILVRHAETIWHQENRYAGRSDVALTEAGHRQAEQLGLWCAATSIDAIWTSPLSRCRITAAPAAASTGCVPVIDDRLIELDFGSLEGRTKAEARALFPVEMANYLRDPVANHFAGGESPQAAADRACDCLRDIVAQHPDQRVLVVGHSTLTRLALCRILGIGLSLYRRRFPVLANCAVTQIRFDDGEAGLIAFNVPPNIPSSQGKDAVA
jgi:broad specificity phosphatase PhoE